MKKTIIVGVIVVCLFISLVVTVGAVNNQVQAILNYRDIKIVINGNEVTPQDANGNAVEPFIIDGTTYLPVRAVSSALGLDVRWDDATSTVSLSEPEASKPVHITRTGKKYHYDSTCNGGTYWEVPYSSATGMGLEPCDKCVLK